MSQRYLTQIATVLNTRLRKCLGFLTPEEIMSQEIKLLKTYLAGCESSGVNAFFIRNDVGRGIVQEVQIGDAWIRNAQRTARFGKRECLESFQGFPLVEM